MAEAMRLLTQETNLPIEAFYAWGRKDVPATLAELRRYL